MSALFGVDYPDQQRNNNASAVPAMRGPGFSTIESDEMQLLRYKGKPEQNKMARSFKHISQGTFSNATVPENSQSEESQVDEKSSSGLQAAKFDNMTHVRLGNKLGDSRSETGYQVAGSMPSDVQVNLAVSLNDSSQLVDGQEKG